MIKLNRQTKSALKIAPAALILVLAFTNCYSVNKAPVQTSGTEEETQNETFNREPAEIVEIQEDNTEIAPAVNVALRSCQFISVSSIQSVLRNTLGLSSGDVTAVDEYKNPIPSYQYVEKYRGALGEGNFVDMDNQVADDHTCTSLKFKAAMIIFLEACTVSMENPRMKTSLFPQGVNNYDNLYLKTTGRMPKEAEVSILDGLVESVSDTIKPAAACAAVLTSISVLDQT